MADVVHNYDAVAHSYEFVSHFYSTGQIKAAKVAQLDWLPAGARVLYLGCGSGEDVIEAVRRGFDVTAIDASKKMIGRLERKLEKHDLSADLVCGNVFAYQPATKFDAVAANFFFNVFSNEQLDRIVDYALTLIKPDGCLLVADVALPEGWLPSRLFNWIYINGAQFSAATLGLLRLHKNHDFKTIFAARELEIGRQQSFRFCRVGPVLFQSMKVDLNGLRFSQHDSVNDKGN